MSYQARRHPHHAALTGQFRVSARLAGAVLAGSLLLAGCSSGQVAGTATATSGAASNTSTQPTAASSAAGLGQLRKILVIMEENHSIQQIFPGGMPYLWTLAQRYAYATDWSDVAHPSLPNYLAIFGGSDFNRPRDCPPAACCTYPGPSVFGQALSRGGTAKAYEESMSQPCDHGFDGEYDVNHNPVRISRARPRAAGPMTCRRARLPAARSPMTCAPAPSPRSASSRRTCCMTATTEHPRRRGLVAAELGSRAHVRS